MRHWTGWSLDHHTAQIFYEPFLLQTNTNMHHINQDTLINLLKIWNCYCVFKYSRSIFICIEFKWQMRLCCWCHKEPFAWRNRITWRRRCLCELGWRNNERFHPSRNDTYSNNAKCACTVISVSRSQYFTPLHLPHYILNIISVAQILVGPPADSVSYQSFGIHMPIYVSLGCLSYNWFLVAERNHGDIVFPHMHHDCIENIVKTTAYRTNDITHNWRQW